METVRQYVEVWSGGERIRIVLECNVEFHKDTCEYEVKIPMQKYRISAEMARTKAVFERSE